MPHSSKRPIASCSSAATCGSVPSQRTARRGVSIRSAPPSIYEPRPASTVDVIPDHEIVTHGHALTGWKVLLWNDDVHSMDYVVLVLIKTLGLETERAVQVMLEAHENGRAVAWSGAKEPAEMYRDQLEAYGLTATLSD